MRANHQLEWRDIDALTVEVATSVGPSRVAVRLELDAGGDITDAYAEARPRPVGKTIVPTPWGGVFGDYQEMRGIRLPTYADCPLRATGRPVHVLARKDHRPRPHLASAREGQG